jgi:hypothetical protein
MRATQGPLGPRRLGDFFGLAKTLLKFRALGIRRLGLRSFPLRDFSNAEAKRTLASMSVHSFVSVGKVGLQPEQLTGQFVPSQSHAPGVVAARCPQFHGLLIASHELIVHPAKRDLSQRFVATCIHFDLPPLGADAANTKPVSHKHRS